MAKKVKVGRPAGSPNREYAAVEEIPAQCVKCKGSNFTRIPGSKDIDRFIEGRLRSGFEYNFVRRTRKRCECGQVLVVTSYSWVEGGKPQPAPSTDKSAYTPIEQVAVGKPYRCWCEARQTYVTAELVDLEGIGQRWRTDYGAYCRLDALLAVAKIEQKK